MIIRAFLFYFIFLLSWKIERQLREKEKRGKHFEFLEEMTEEESRLLVMWITLQASWIVKGIYIYIYYQSHLGHGSEKERRRATCTEIKAMKMPRLLLLLLFFFFSLWICMQHERWFYSLDPTILLFMLLWNLLLHL